MIEVRRTIMIVMISTIIMMRIFIIMIMTIIIRIMTIMITPFLIRIIRHFFKHHIVLFMKDLILYTKCSKKLKNKKLLLL